MNRDQKAAVVDQIAEQIEAADAVFAVDYRGISVEQAAELRARLRDSGTRFRIVKNSLTERAADKAGAGALKAMLEGPTALAFVSGDAALAAKALSDAARTLRTLEFKGGLMDATELSAADVQSIARLPARDVLHAQLVGTIAAPLSGLVRTLNALIAGVAIQLQQIAEQGLVTGEAPPPAPAGESPEPEGSTESAQEGPVAAPEAAEGSAAESESAPEAPEAAELSTAESESAPESPEARPADAAVDVEAEPAGSPPPAETDQEPAPGEEPGA